MPNLNPPRIIIVFGKMGSGKTTGGEIRAKQLGYEFLEGDNSVPLYMREKVKKFADLTIEDIDQLVVILIKNIEKIIASDRNVVVSQALYLNKHRKLLQDAFKKYNIQFIEIDAPIEKQMAQLASRDPDGEKWKQYAIDNDKHYQQPDACLNAITIKNTGDKTQLIAELAKLDAPSGVNRLVIDTPLGFFTGRDEKESSMLSSSTNTKTAKLH